MDKTTALNLGSPVRFHDCWSGHLTAIDVDDDWEVLNLQLTRGLWRWTSSVKLPFSAVSEFSPEYVAFDATSDQAFNREIPPVAAMMRTLSPTTQVSLPGSAIAGVLVEGKFARALLIHESTGRRRRLRIPADKATFEGSALRLIGQSDSLPIYRDDEEVLAQIRDAISSSPDITQDDRRNVTIIATGGAVVISGNVRTGVVRHEIDRIVSSLYGAASVTNEIVDDLSLEIALGWALERGGVQRTSDIYVRSALGEVTVFGRAHSPTAADDVIRLISQTPGVCSVKSRLETKSAA